MTYPFCYTADVKIKILDFKGKYFPFAGGFEDSVLKHF